MGILQQDWSGLPCPPPGYLPDPGIEQRSPALQADSLPAKLPGKPFSFYQLDNTKTSVFKFEDSFLYLIEPIVEFQCQLHF